LPPAQTEVVAVRQADDVLRVRQVVRTWAIACRFSLVDQTKIITAASEIARNTVIYGGGGDLKLEALEERGRAGLRLSFTDRGPGIIDVEQALRDGFTTGGGLGLGLGGARRLVNDFAIESQPGAGTTVRLTRWK
jgi:serine/threonine-protein kinase RsbT